MNFKPDYIAEYRRRFQGLAPTVGELYHRHKGMIRDGWEPGYDVLTDLATYIHILGPGATTNQPIPRVPKVRELPADWQPSPVPRSLEEWCRGR